MIRLIPVHENDSQRIAEIRGRLREADLVSFEVDTIVATVPFEYELPLAFS